MGWIFPPITPRELQEWEGFERVMGPILIHERLELTSAIVAMTSAAPHTPANRPLHVTDFMPRWDPKAPDPNAQSPEAIMEAIKALGKKEYTDGE